MNTMFRIVGAIALAGALMLGSGWALERTEQQALGPAQFGERWLCAHAIGGERAARTELYFGLSKPNGVVSEEEFQRFVDREVTPRFPEGLTVMSGKGQFKNAAGDTVAEGAKLLILLYPASRKRSDAIEQVRDAYKRAFEQQSVLRVDEQICASY